MAKYGFGSVNSNFNTKNNFSVNNSLNQDLLVSFGRVVNVILDGDDYKSIGTVEFTGIDSTPSDISNINPQANLMSAKPLLSNIKNYPLVNEVVLIFRLPDVGIKSSTASKSLYYLSILSMWNHPHHNALPYYEGNLQPTQQKSYVQTELGSPKIATNQSTEIYLGKTFKEKSTINPLLPFEGDVIYEGRWGNSIRFGSTNKTNISQSPVNNWSSGSSNSGDPILILRNGQGPEVGNGYEYITEDINTDFGSIYFGSTQQIPLNTSSTSYVSYKTNPPTIPNQYNGKQVIINSGRLVFNSFEDHILFSSKKSINLNAVESVNIDAPTTVIQSTNTYIGSKNANEPLLLGNQTVNLLNQLITNLSGFMTICSTVASVPIPQLNTAAAQLNVSLQALQANLETLKSKYNYTV
jgi:hypothetical protein